MAKRNRKPRASFRSLYTGADHRTLRGNVAEHLEWLEVRGYTEDTVEHRAQVLHYFAAWCEERGLVRSAEVTRPILQRYQRWLFYYRKKNGSSSSLAGL